MEMDARLEGATESKDILIQRTNRLLVRKGFAPLFDSYYLTRGELKEAIRELQKMNDFTSKDQILLHFNRYAEAGNPKYQYTDHVATYKFPTKVVAKAFIEATIREAWERVPQPSKRWVSDTRLALNDWIIITANGPHTLEDIMEANSAKYTLPAPYDYYAEQIMAYHWGAHPQVNARSLAAKGEKLSEEDKQKYAPPSRIRESTERKQKERQELKRAPRETKAPKLEKAPKQDANTVSLASICAELGYDAKEARTALRKFSYPKPSSGWQWPQAQKAKISADVKELVLKTRKKS